jgi:hypothetical protein
MGKAPDGGKEVANGANLMFLHPIKKPHTMQMFVA